MFTSGALACWLGENLVQGVCERNFVLAISELGIEKQ
jgi:hypothetical protein